GRILCHLLLTIMLFQAYSLAHLYEDHEDRNTDQIQSYRTKLIHQELQRGKCLIKSKSWYDDTTAVGHPPVITVDGFDDSGGLRLQCESEGWNPEPVLEWLNSEGVSLSSETTDTHRNTDGFSVKHTVYERDSKINCRVRLRHHMLETQIVTNVHFTVYVPFAAEHNIYFTLHNSSKTTCIQERLVLLTENKRPLYQPP
uniref:Ig-like domain-containing protein n=1 Tax=Sinocyclocheilus rhinocerous TaxID=307959 RepID=A0A673JWP7_9TELE